MWRVEAEDGVDNRERLEIGRRVLVTDGGRLGGDGAVGGAGGGHIMHGTGLFH